MIYLETFSLPYEDRRVYPYRTLCSKVLETIRFSPVTVFYGNNGSGKSTLLNVIAEKLNVKHKTLGNSSFYFNEFVEKSNFQTAERNGKNVDIPTESRFIRSEDIMEAIVRLRNKTEKAERRILEVKDKDDRTRMFAWQHHNELSEQYSNGETAISFFENIFEPNTLYLLDEPENSFSSKLQLLLKNMIEKYAHLYNCQFIIATHSPFVLAIENAKVYNLDSQPVTECRWQDLENIQLLYKLFRDSFPKI